MCNIADCPKLMCLTALLGYNFPDVQINGHGDCGSGTAHSSASHDRDHFDAHALKPLILISVDSLSDIQ